MPNYCDYEMKVKGSKKSVEEFIGIIQANYNIDENKKCNCERHFWRVFEADVIDKRFENGEGYAEIAGCCAWSVYSCMCDGDFTYNSDFPNLGGTTLQKESERLHISIEVFSSECGCQFMEHYIYHDGDCVANECVKWEEYRIDEFSTVDELNAEYDTNFTQEEFDNAEDGYLSIGGLEWNFSI